MIRFVCFVLFSSTVFFSHSLEAQNRRSGVSFTGQRATTVEQKRVPLQKAQMGGHSQLQNQRFGIEEWRKQFSPLGQRRAGIDAHQQSRLSQRRFDTQIVSFPEQVYEMALYNQQMAQIRQQAHLNTAARVHDIERAPRTLMDLQNTTHFTDQVKEADLSSINRFQFRRNRADGIPSETAGQHQLPQ
jgi:hypothetical protein